MQGATFDEFKTMLAESWEIDFAYGEHEFHYERSGCKEGFSVYLLKDGEYLFQEVSSDMSGIVQSVLSLKACDGLTFEQAQENVTVISEA